MSNPTPPIAPIPNLGSELLDDDAATKEVDGRTVLDPDANDELVDSAEADRVAADGDATPDSV